MLLTISQDIFQLCQKQQHVFFFFFYENSRHFPALLVSTALDILNCESGRFPAVSMATNVDIQVQEGSGQFPSVLVTIKLDIFDKLLGYFPWHVHGIKKLGNSQKGWRSLQLR